MEEFVPISTEYITLDALLKWTGIVDSGGQAKAVIIAGKVMVNGEVETRRGRKLRAGDKISFLNAGTWIVTRKEP